MTEPDEAEIPVHPTDFLINLVAMLLTPMFLAAANADPVFARMAALETLNAYRVRDQADLIRVALIISFSLAALGSLSQAMEADTTPAFALRLRGSANACQRSAASVERTRATMPAVVESPPVPEPDPQAEAQLLQDVAEARHKVAQAQAAPCPRPERQLWAAAAANVAAELVTSLPNLPPAERREATLQARALASSADHLLKEAATPGPGAAAVPVATRPAIPEPRLG